jgi:hypothetical protein
VRPRADERTEAHPDLARDDVRKSHRAALVRHVNELRAGKVLEELAAEMLHTERSRRAVIDLSRIRLRIRDQLANRGRRYGRVQRQYVEERAHLRNRLEVLQEIIGKLGVHRGIYRL